jgi:hypothetical protein
LYRIVKTYTFTSMYYWTIQTYDGWLAAQDKGVLVGDEAYVWEDFIRPYQWLMKQMSLRLPNYKGEYPVWMYAEKPDLRKCGFRNFSTKGTRAVLLRVEVEPVDVLCSDYMTWHSVLNDFELEAYEGEVIDKELSWQRIFDFDFLREFNEGEDKYIVRQYTTGTVPLTNIKHIKTYTTR